MDSEDYLYQVNYHDGGGWKVIPRQKLVERMGAAFTYAEWLFDQGQTMAQSHVGYRRVRVAPPMAEIIVSRDGHFYRYTRILNGRPDVVDRPIGKELAQDIAGNNPGGDGRPDFGPEPCSWEYTAVIALEEIEA